MRAEGSLKIPLLAFCNNGEAHASSVIRPDPEGRSVWHAPLESSESSASLPRRISSSLTPRQDLDDDNGVPLHFSMRREIMFSWLNFIVYILRSLPMQFLFFMMFLLHVCLTVYGCATQRVGVIPFIAIVGFTFVCEHVWLIASEKFYFFPLTYRRVLTCNVVCVLMVFAMELFMLVMWTVDGNALVIYVGVLVSLLMFFPRCRQLGLSLRTCVSSERRRYQIDGFDLDLSFIDRTVVAMSWPADNFERLFRNPAKEVEKLLNLRYGLHGYHVFNLCAERRYVNPGLFHGNVSYYPMDDHNPAELDVMMAFARESWDFVRKDPEKRVIAVHCRGGKGRTGTMVCAYLMYSGLVTNAKMALEQFGVMRTAVGGKFQGVQTPSQERYVCYFERLLSSMRSPSIPVTKPSPGKRITKMLLCNIPPLWWNSGIEKLWFVIILKPCTERRVVYISSPYVTFDVRKPVDSRGHMWSQLRDVSVSTERSFYCESQSMDKSLEGFPCHSGFLAHMQNGDMEVRNVDDQLSEHASLRNADVRVTLEALGLEKIPPLEGDVVIKFYYAKKHPDPLKPPVQLWFNTAMESEELILGRSQLDGPHKDVAGKHYPNEFMLKLHFQDV